MQVEHSGEYATVFLPEVIDLTNVTEFKKILQSLYEQGCRVIDIDCSRLQMIDSAGLGSLVMFQKKLKEHCGELKLVNVSNDYIKHLFDMIDLKRVINFGTL